MHEIRKPVLDILHGKEEMRARDLFFALWISDLFMKRVESDGEEQEIAYNPACHICGLSSYTNPCQGKCRFYFHRECIGIFDEQQTLICPDCSSGIIK